MSGYLAGSDGVGGPLGANGLVEVGGIRIHDASYVLEGLGGLTDTPDVRTTLTDIGEAHGSFLSGSYYTARTVTVEGYTLADDVADLWPLMDRLRGAFSLTGGSTTLLTLQALLPGWTERRFVRCRPSSPLVVEQRGGSEARVPLRRWQASVVCPDPRVQGVTLRGTNDPLPGASGGSVQHTTANAGNFPSPVRWVVNGPAESPSLIDDGNGLGINYFGPVATGRTLVVDTLARTATLDGGNVYKNLTRFDAITVRPGGTALRSTTQPTNNGGLARVEHRDTWV